MPRFINRCTPGIPIGYFLEGRLILGPHPAGIAVKLVHTRGVPAEQRQLICAGSVQGHSDLRCGYAPSHNKGVPLQWPGGALERRFKNMLDGRSLIA